MRIRFYESKSARDIFSGYEVSQVERGKASDRILVAAIFECLVRFVATLGMLIVGVAISLTIAFLAWFFEFLFDEISFIDWVNTRWYFIVAIFVLVAWSTLIEIRKDDRAWQKLVELSDSLDVPKESSNINRILTTTIDFDNNTIGTCTIATTEQGLEIWSTGKLRAFFTWNRFESIQVFDKNHGGQRAVLTFKWKLPTDQPQLEIS